MASHKFYFYMIVRYILCCVMLLYDYW